jgi:hypothetical protein
MPKPLTLSVTLQPRGPAAAVILTDEQVQGISGGPKTPPVIVTVNGYTFRGRVGRMNGENLVGFNKANRDAAGVAPGDKVKVQIALDEGERSVDVPDDLAKALTTARATDAFSKLAPSHRKEYVRWITEAKRPETRAKRIDEAVPLIRDGRPRR